VLTGWWLDETTLYQVPGGSQLRAIDVVRRCTPLCSSKCATAFARAAGRSLLCVQSVDRVDRMWAELIEKLKADRNPQQEHDRSAT
jgi:hypothetical protein